MSENNKQTKVTNSQYTQQLVYYSLGVIEVLLCFRFVLKLAGANPTSGFVQLIYNLTGLFILPFEGIFRRAVSEGIETSSIIEPATIVAIIAYAFIAWGIVTLMSVLAGEAQSE